MTRQSSHLASLRQRAESRHRETHAGHSPPSEADLRRIQHELEVHQIELELQCEELGKAYCEIESGLERFTELFEFAPVGYFNLGPDGTIHLANFQLASLLGIERALLVGRRFGQFVAEADRRNFNSFLSNVFSSTGPQTCELAISRPGSPPLFARLEAKCPSGSRECRVVLIDISERKQAEAVLRENEDFLRSTIDSLDSHTVVLEDSGKIWFVNRAWREFASENGAEARDVLEGANYLTVCDNVANSCNEAAAVAAAVRGVLNGEPAHSPVLYPCHSPNEQRWFSCSVCGFERGNKRFAVVLHTNVTTHKEGELRMQQANDELTRARRLAESASLAKGQFLANMSHEIRTPLTAILGYAELLREQGDTATTPEQRIQAIESISRAGQHLLTLINDILDLSKIESGKMTAETIETPLVHVLADTVDLMRLRAEEKGLTLRLRLTSPLPERVRTDPTRLRQILTNLIGNSVKFTASGSVTVNCGVESVDGWPRMVIEVEDTGIGMTRQQSDQVFNAFSQADGSVSRRFGGSGLGLTVSRQLANLMGGDVSLLRTEPGRGSCFRLVLPLDAVVGCEMVSSVDAMSKSVESKPAASSITLSGRILLAEDGPDNQRLIAFHLRKAGATVDVADNGRQALAMLDKASDGGTPYDLLLTDIQMPEMDGYTLARTLRERGSAIPIVALTAAAMSEDRTKCLSAGCDYYASKPIYRSDLLSICAAWIGRKHAGSRFNV